jgi:1-aminocyclopropane-1-carboxylate deaminase/D-cysteine desulfhydrase-like pyridoxal-dependent ACC family enzyme
MFELPDTVPLQRLENELILQKSISFYVLRLDLIERYAGGNKIFKLKYNLEEALRQEHKRILTFGGAWSNHLAAVSSMQLVVSGKQKMEVIAVVRGEEPRVYSDTMRFCREHGMKLHFVSREDYRKRNDVDFIEALRKMFGDFYLLPEGGSNAMAVKGCREIVNYISVPFDVICCPVGSGGTLAGIISGLKEGHQALGFVALKGGEYLRDVITELVNPPLSLRDISPQEEASLSRSAGLSPPKGERKFSFELNYGYHFGGFAKVTDELLRFKKGFEQEFGFELDYVYTSKMFFGLFDLIAKDVFKPGTTLVAIHTGGLQGNKGFEQ